MINQHLAKITIFAITALSPLVMANDFADIITEHANADVKEWLANPATSMRSKLKTPRAQHSLPINWSFQESRYHH
jgi:hypothetical protein